ncbi:MAG: sugar phosphate isomerase/epimerase [Paucimonas sp.]|nr:sugar phosphate isomerase/epimerase [Paucimonas sp.]
MTTRRDFLKTGTSLLGLVTATPVFAAGKADPLLSFSTLACPDWSFERITDFAASHGYRGIEVRGIQRELDLTQRSEFSRANRASTLRRMRDKRLEFVGLNSSVELHHADAAKREKHLADGKRYIDLAAELKCPYVRVFPNELPKDQDRSQTLDLITTGLIELGKHARGSGVTVLLESHGDVTAIADLEKIMRAAAGRHIGLIWDVVNMWSVTKEAPADVHKALKRYIRHVHLKDMTTMDGKQRYVLLGRGDAPVFDAIGLLDKSGYAGYYSFEWEKLWHPEIEEPEVALADYAQVMKRRFQ